MKPSAFLLFVFFASSFAALGAEKSVVDLCPDLGALAQQVNHCQKNPFFVQAADLCLAKLSGEVKAKTATLALAMGKANAQASSAQAAKLGNQQQNLASATASLEALKMAAERIRDKIKAYRENFMRAGLVNKNFASRLSRPFLNILESFPCYKDNYALITRYIEASEAKVGEISATLAGVSTLNGRTVASKSLIEATSVHSPASSSKGLGTGARAGGTAPKKSSSITGVEEEAARRGQAKKP